MSQIDRIAQMEAILNESAAALDALDAALERVRQVSPGMQSLFDYYFSPLWRQDYEDDCVGRLPADFPRGVLSEDAVYTLFLQKQDLSGELKSLAKAFSRTD